MFQNSTEILLKRLYIHIQGVSKLMVHTLGGDRTHQDE